MPVQEQEAPIRTWKTTDLALAAFFKFNGVKLLDYKPSNKGNGRQLDFVFDDSKGECSRLEIEWQNSDMRLFDTEVRSLKKLANSNRIRKNDKR